MIRKISRIDNSIVVGQPKAMLGLPRVSEGEKISAELDAKHRQIPIAPAPTAADGVDAELARQVADFISAYRPALAR